MKQEIKEKLKDIVFYILIIFVVFLVCSFISNFIVDNFITMPSEIDKEYFKVLNNATKDI